MPVFEGDVQCGPCNAVINLWLRGRVRTPSGASDVDLFFSGASVLTLPPLLHETRVLELDTDPGGLHRYRIESRELNVDLQARSLQLHRAAGAQLFGAVPPTRVPWHVRAGWALLLSLLRLPGVGHLLLGRRGSA
jgi:hypothetical protein